VGIIITIVAVVVVLAVAVLVGRTLILRRAAAGGASIANTLHLNARWWKEQRPLEGQLLYIAIGDSAAQGVGASMPGRSYVGMLAQHLRRRTGQTVRVVNLSVSGARLRDALSIQLPELAKLGLQPDLMTVAIGANDMAAFDAERFERELRQIYDSLPAGAIVGDVPAFYIGAREKSVRTANSIVHRLAAERGLAVAPVYARTKRQGAARYAFNQVAADFFHPNDRGYRVWTSAFLPLLDSRFPATRSPAEGQ
jgi:acyl-CoA thioesterase-1